MIGKPDDIIGKRVGVEWQRRRCDVRENTVAR
jgi:hypothetical protein